MQKTVVPVMLPDIGDRSRLGAYPCVAYRLAILEGKIFKPSDAILIFLEKRDTEKMPYSAQHVYFISADPKEEIRDGDYVLYWFISQTPQEGKIHKVVGGSLPKCNRAKIIACTDPSLGLPDIPQSWIKNKWIPSNGTIKEVKLSTYTTEDCPEEMQSHPFSESTWYQTYVGKLKIVGNQVVITEFLGDNDKRIIKYLKDKQEELQKVVDKKVQDIELEDAASRYAAIPEEGPDELNSDKRQGFIAGWLACKNQRSSK